MHAYNTVLIKTYIACSYVSNQDSNPHQEVDYILSSFTSGLHMSELIKLSFQILIKDVRGVSRTYKLTQARAP